MIFKQPATVSRNQIEAISFFSKLSIKRFFIEKSFLVELKQSEVIPLNKKTVSFQKENYTPVSVSPDVSRFLRKSL